MLHIPAIQRTIGSQVSTALSKKLGTDIQVGRIDLGIFNRIVIDDVLIKDQQGERLLAAGRLSAKFDLFPLLQGDLSISAAQFFGIKLHTYKQTADSKPNFQFILDSLASKDTTSQSSFNLNIHSVIIRHGALSFHQNDAPETPHKFNLKHLSIDKISAHIILNQLTDSLFDINIKSLALKEKSGIELKHLTLHLNANNHEATLKDFRLDFPHSHLILSNLQVMFRRTKQGIEMPSIQFIGNIDKSTITLSELAPFATDLKDFNTTLDIESQFFGTSTYIRVQRLQIKNKEITLNVNGSLRNWQSTPQWAASVEQLSASDNSLQILAKSAHSQQAIFNTIARLGNIQFKGNLGGYGQDIALKGILHTDQGHVNIAVGKHNHNFSGHIDTPSMNLGHILCNNKFGILATRINIDGTLPFKSTSTLKVHVKGNLNRFEYNQYTYQNIRVDGNFEKRASNSIIDGLLIAEDPNGAITIQGELSSINRVMQAHLQASADELNLSAMRLPSPWPRAKFSGTLSANIQGKDLNTATGYIDLDNIQIIKSDSRFDLENLHIQAGYQNKIHFLNAQSDFGSMAITGNFDYITILQSIASQIGNKISTLPGLPAITTEHRNNFAIQTTINNTEWLNKLFNIPLTINAPITLNGNISDIDKKINLVCTLPSFEYQGGHYEAGALQITTPNDTIKASAQIKRIDARGHAFSWNLDAHAANNKLGTTLSWRNQNKKIFKGLLTTETNFFKTSKGVSSAHIKIHPSEVLVEDTVWHIEPSNVIYSKNHLTVDHFAIYHNNQHAIISGVATQSSEDSLQVHLQDVNISYLLNLVNFHAVDFSGLASGHASVSSVFKAPHASGTLQVNNFRFENGRMGTLLAHVNYDNIKGQINIDAVANDEDGKHTVINGYVSPKKNYIDLGIAAHDTRLEFLESFCGSFMNDIRATARGQVKLFGPLNQINLSGQLITNGNIHMSSLNTDYTLVNDTVRFAPNHIYLKSDTIYDRNKNIGIVDGTIFHQHLTHLSYNIGIKAQNLLAYDTHSFGSNTFYGTAYVTGKCNITGRSGEIVIDVDATPEKGSKIVYNAASPTAISSQEFIHWSSRDSIPHQQPAQISADNKEEQEAIDIPTDIRINFLVNTTPDAMLQLIMDQQTGDFINLFGNGVLRANYYNKGSFDMYGNYEIERGIYKLTIQNVIKKDFIFRQGGTITFGGDPYAALLNLKAMYTVAGVSLSDLNIGRSFAGNNIRVNCLMNITGTPSSPKIDFSLDLPTVNPDAKQMVFSLINSEEEMNQQVLYLLAVGRFYTQGANNSTLAHTQQSQTSLAMQSILSGTVSQQLNNVLSSVVKNNNWNFGANISTGDEGWNNAEYEGLLSGRMLQNRLIFNGQFGYRDNTNTATTSFIGDFDLRYLLYPNGNFAIRVYNQTNDRYFTRNSLNTQGLGFILKRDFTNWRDLFGSKRKKQTDKDSIKNVKK